MWLILLEMLLALGLGVFIVWWTMFHRPKPEQQRHAQNEVDLPPPPPR